ITLTVAKLPYVGADGIRIGLIAARIAAATLPALITARPQRQVASVPPATFSVHSTVTIGPVGPGSMLKPILPWRAASHDIASFSSEISVLITLFSSTCRAPSSGVACCGRPYPRPPGSAGARGRSRMAAGVTVQHLGYDSSRYRLQVQFRLS